MSKLEKNQKNDKIFLKIAEGTIRRPVAKGTPDAVERDWTAGGDSGTAHEIIYPAIFGRITNVDFYDGEKDGRRFTTLNLTLDENEDGLSPKLGVSVTSKYAQDIMKKLPNVNFDEEVRIRPFAFTPEGEEKEIVGVEITQRGPDDNFSKKIDNFFSKKEGDKWVEINGFPKRAKAWGEQTDGERKIFNIQKEEFLINHTKQHILPKFANPDALKIKYDEGEAAPEEVPEF